MSAAALAASGCLSRVHWVALHEEESAPTSPAAESVTETQQSGGRRCHQPQNDQVWNLSCCEDVDVICCQVRGLEEVGLHRGFLESLHEAKCIGNYGEVEVVRTILIERYDITIAAIMYRFHNILHVLSLPQFDPFLLA